MLDSIDLNDKSFEQIRDEAIAQIPIYSKDWTNYNISDPGVTILENFAAFLALQQGELNEVPEKIRKKLLGLAGFTARRGNAANAYVSLWHAAGSLPYVMPRRAKLYAQDICFEPPENENLVLKDIRITAVKADGMTELHTQLQTKQLLKSGGVRGGLRLLGEKPSGGETICLYFEDLPCAGARTAVYFDMAEPFKRNRMEPGSPNPFVSVKWELAVLGGYSEINVCDTTCGFLQCGYVSFVLEKELCRRAVKDELEDAYVIKITVERAAYDINPCFQGIWGLLMHMVQKDTKSDVVRLCLSGRNDICISHYLLKNGYLEIYSSQNGRHQRYYEGRHYRTQRLDSFTRKIIFERDVPRDIIAVVRDESMMVHSKLGTLYGYDNQVIELPGGEAVYHEGFSVLVVEDDGCHVAYPEDTAAGEVCYSINETENTLTIHDCGRYEGAVLWMGNYTVYKGNGGNILAGTELVHEQENDRMKMVFANCTDVTDGTFEEDCAQLQSRFAQDVRTPVTMVTQGDCETIVRNIPGLSIHKIGVFPVPGKNEIHITVKPDSHEPRPELSRLYADEISTYLEKYRMLTTKIVIRQPVYVPVNVAGIIYIKKHFERCRERIETLLGEMLDGIHSDACFGSRIVFHDIYRRLSAVDGVDQIYELSIVPDNFRHADMSGMDIQLASNALYYPGNFRLELTDAKGGG